MEPQYHCVANCRYCMVGWRCIEHQAYVCIIILVVEPSTYGLCPASACKDLTLVRSFTGALILESTNWRLCKLCKAIGTVKYNPKIDACIVTHTHRGVTNGIGILVVDVMLLLTMLTGLLRYAYLNSTGIWKFLYQQVTLKTFSSTCASCWLRSSV
jgi:hypothetical protein